MQRLLHLSDRWQVRLRQWVLAAVMVLVSSLLLAAPVGATGVYEIPLPTADSWVMDRAEVLSLSSEGKISAALEKLAEQTGYEVRMVTIHRLDYDETAQSFADKLFEKWFPTEAEQAKQVVIVLDNVTDNIGIHTGSQVKDLLTDEIAQSVTQETMTIPLNQGNKYNQAFIDASDRLSAVLSGQPDPGPPQVNDTTQVGRTFATAEETQSSNATFWVITILIVATVVPMATYYYYQFMQSR